MKRRILSMLLTLCMLLSLLPTAALAAGTDGFVGVYYKYAKAASTGVSGMALSGLATDKYFYGSSSAVNTNTFVTTELKALPANSRCDCTIRVSGSSYDNGYMWGYLGSYLVGIMLHA